MGYNANVKNILLFGGYMKNFFNRLSSYKMDEMQSYILLRSQRASYFFLVAALFVWSLYESYMVYAYHERLNLIPCLLLVSASIVQNISQAVMTRKAVKDDEEADETGPFIKLAVTLSVLAGVIATAVAAIMIMGVWG